MKKIIATLFVSVLVPLNAFAQQGPGYKPKATPETVNDIFYDFAWGNMKGLIPSLVAVALVTFFVGVVKYIGAGDNEEKRQGGRTMMIYGIVVLFIMVAFWGFVEIAYKTFFTDEMKIPNYLPLKKS